jgi:LacI family transcriptional regulator
VAVVGFDDIAVAASADPPLTTVRQPSDRMGVVATEMLIDMIDHGDAFPHRVVLPTQLIIRDSCGATL